MTNRKQAHGELRERFYQSVAETLSLLHTAPGYDRRLALAEVATILAATMGLPLVWIGRREPEQTALAVLASAGPEAAYATDLKISADEREPGGGGPVASVLRQGAARAVASDAPEFAPWREAAQRHGLGSCIVAAANTRDHGQLTLAAYARFGAPLLGDELLDWAQRLADELGRFWDHQALLERNLRMSRYRDAQRTIQRALLEQPDPAAVYRTLAQALVDIAGAAAVDIYAAEETGDLLQRVALAGPMAEAMQLLPVPPKHSDGPLIFTPTLAFMRGTPVVRVHPAGPSGAAPAWQLQPLAQMGAVACWPLFGVPQVNGDAPAASGVFAVVTAEADAFDAEMCRLLDEITDAAGLALRQHQQRHTLLQKQKLETHLALHDALTNVPNRRALEHHLADVLARAEQRGRLVAVGLLDLDDLKPINDRHGHAAGDRILIEVATRLCGALREEDYVARLGGDEFVLVFENLQREDELDALLARVWQALQQPLVIDDVTFELSASLGIALYPIHGPANGEQLLRYADQAMYRVKARKRQRDRWWGLPAVLEDIAGASEEEDGRGPPPYGELAAELLRPWFATLHAQIPRLAERYYTELQDHEGAGSLFGALPAADVTALKQRLRWHLSVLLRPDLDAATHQAGAVQAGFFYAACGVEEVWLLEATEMLRDIFVATLGSGTHRDQRPLGIVLQRLALDRQWQLASMRKTQRRRVALLARLNALAWSADGYLELIQGAVDALIAHDEILACAVGRPDVSGQLTYEAVAGNAFADYLRALARGETASIGVRGDLPEGGGPSGRAWRTATIQRCAHYGSDAAMTSWREIAARVGLVSSVAVPLCPLPRTPAAVLTLYSAHVGGFQSEDQRAFVEQIKAVLDLALVRLAPPRPGTELLPFFVRERWRALVSTDALQMHYQPVVRLADGRVTELEALARLRDDGSLLPPCRFLPAMGDADLIVLFRQGLLQATACRQALLQAGHALDVSVNAPAAALVDPQYAQTAAAVLANGACPAHSLLLEILETPIGAEHTAPAGMAGMQALKALGVRLVEDDLGAGYSTLIRLRQWPFDRVKIDQAIVRQIGDEPLPTLRFIRQLIRLGHDLNMEVVVEGLETAGSVEAALILGADLAQGYVLARPMPADALPGWIAGFHADWDATHPVTAVGALATALRWEEQFIALPADSLVWQMHAATTCAADNYLRHDGAAPALRSSQAAVHAAAIGGPLDPVYREARDAFLDLLVERVRAEEQHPNADASDASHAGEQAPELAATATDQPDRRRDLRSI